MYTRCRCSYWLDIQTASSSQNPIQQGDGNDHASKTQNKDSDGRPPLRPPTQVPGGPPSPPPALELGLAPSGAVTVISFPQLPAGSMLEHSHTSLTQPSATQGSATQGLATPASSAQGAAILAEAGHESAAQDSGVQGTKLLRLKLDLKTCDVQQLLLQAAATNAGVQLGKQTSVIKCNWASKPL